MTNNELIEIAKEARNNAFTPISNFKVGAALLTKSGKVYKGCNIEDPSGIGLTNICAERCAFTKAISEGEREFAKIAIVAGKDNLVIATPCGICRQYINSFSKDITIICADSKEIKEFKLNDLLPYSFNEEFTNNN